MKRTTSATQPRQRKTTALRAVSPEQLGAHVSTAGGPATAPARGAAIGATAIQIFTKTPNMWREPVVTQEIGTAFRRARDAHELRVVVSHDSYLINLASPDPELRARSLGAFQGELRRAEDLHLDAVVSHPGNYIDDHNAGMERNARAITEALRSVPGKVMLYLEITAGTGTALGRSFEELRTMRDLVEEDVRHRMAFCADTCHLYSAGYDLVTDFDGVWAAWDRIIGFRLAGLHAPQRLEDPVRVPPRSARADRRRLAGRRAVPPDHERPQFAGIPKLFGDPEGGRRRRDE